MAHVWALNLGTLNRNHKNILERLWGWVLGQSLEELLADLFGDPDLHFTYVHKVGLCFNRK